MKTLKITMLLVIMLLLTPIISQAQNSDDKRSYRVHEDHVKLSMVSEYEKTVKELISLLKKHNLQDVSWITLNSNDSRYSFVSSINGMSDLDKPSFVKTLVEKEGKEAVYDIFDRMDKCYDIELDYILHLDKELTYMPEGFTQTPEGKNYRNNHMLYVTPGNRKMVKEKMKAIKALFEKKGSKEYYRVYRSGFGSNGEYYMVAIAAKDEADYARQSNENDELLGEDGKKVLGGLFSNLLKYEKIEGWIRPDLAYSPKK
jgi:Fe-S cluster assembly scaffold protein SufB